MATKLDQKKSGAKYILKPHPDFGFLRVQPTPTLEEIEQYYASQFYSPSYPRFNNSSLENQLADKEFYDGFRDDLCATVQELKNQDLKGLKLLDVGCGWAQALLYFKNRGLDSYGFDPASDAVAYAQKNGLKVVQAGFESMDVFKGQKFDIVTLFDVLEHLTDPVSVLRDIRSTALKQDGVLIITVPNEFNPLQLVAQKVHNLEEWWVAPPAHLNYFNKETLSKLLEGLNYQVLRTESSFPLEIFLAFGDNYVKDRALGKECHKKRVNFELNLRKHGKLGLLRKLYENLAELGLGREITVFATPKGN